VARAELPPQLETYFLLSEVIRLSPGEPNPELRAVLREGVRMFPETRGLALAAAVWEARAGDRSAALRLLDLGLAAAPTGTDRDRLLDLRRRLSATALPGGAPTPEVDPWSFAWSAQGADPGVAPGSTGGMDPRDRRDLGLSPDGRHLAYLAPFGGRTERLVIVDLDRPIAPVTLSLPRAPHSDAGPLGWFRGRGGAGAGIASGSSRSAGAALAGLPGSAGSARPGNGAMGATPRSAPRLAWTAAGRIVVGLGTRAVFSVDATGSGLEWPGPKDPDFAAAALPTHAGAPDLSPVVLDRRTQRPVGRRIPTASSRTGWSDPQLAAVQAGLEAKLPDRRISLLDWDQARSRFLAVAQTPDGRGRCFVFRPDDRLLLEVPLEGP
jgi:hypothetical protein